MSFLGCTSQTYAPDLYAEVCLAVGIQEFINVDLFECGHYAVQVYPVVPKSMNITSGNVVYSKNARNPRPIRHNQNYPKPRVNTPASGGSNSKTQLKVGPFHVKYTQTVCSVGCGIELCIRIPLDLSNPASLDQQLTNTNIPLNFELLFHESDETALKKVDTQSMLLMGVASPGTYHAGKVTFGFFHTAAVEVTVTSKLVGFLQSGGGIASMMNASANNGRTYVYKGEEPSSAQSSDGIQIGSSTTDDIGPSSNGIEHKLCTALRKSWEELAKRCEFLELQDTQLPPLPAPTHTSTENHPDWMELSDDMRKAWQTCICDILFHDYAFIKGQQISAYSLKWRRRHSYLQSLVHAWTDTEVLTDVQLSRFLDRIARLRTAIDFSKERLFPGVVEKSEFVAPLKDLPIVIEEMYLHNRGALERSHSMRHQDANLDNVKHECAGLHPHTSDERDDFITESNLRPWPNLHPHGTPNLRDKEHLVICVHGLAGNRYDLRLFVLKLREIFPAMQIFMSSCNENNTHDSFETMTDAFEMELLGLLDSNTDGIKKISFVGHSLGNIIIRNVFTRPKVLAYFTRSARSPQTTPAASREHTPRTSPNSTPPSSPSLNPLYKLHTLLSLCGPHLGALYGDGIVGAGMWVLSKWKKSKSLPELSLLDHENPKESLIYRLSNSKCFEYFKNVVLLASPQDKYVPISSSLIHVTGRIESDSGRNAGVYREMVRNLLDPLSSATCRTNLHRLYLFIPSGGYGFNSLIGRKGHLAMLDNDQAVETVMMGVWRFFE